MFLLCGHVWGPEARQEAKAAARHQVTVCTTVFAVTGRPGDHEVAGGLAELCYAIIKPSCGAGCPRGTLVISSPAGHQPWYHSLSVLMWDWERKDIASYGWMSLSGVYEVV